MTKKEYEKKVKEILYDRFKNSRTKEYIDKEIEKEKEWFFSFYEETKDEDYKYTDDYAINLAVTNFSMWL